jgi:predicted transport protein
LPAPVAPWWPCSHLNTPVHPRAIAAPQQSCQLRLLERVNAPPPCIWSSTATTKPACPLLSEEQRQLYKSSNRQAVHLQLANPQIRAVFDALDAGIRALDPNVSQEVLKLTIAYKAETNVVDIVPQGKRLRLNLNMPFADLDDPKGLAKDVTDIGRWGNGDVEIGIATLEEVPYAIGLIRQSLDRQLDDNDATG